MYVGAVAYLNIYVPDDLADAVRSRGINVSRTCRTALQRKVRETDKRWVPTEHKVDLKAWVDQVSQVGR